MDMNILLTCLRAIGTLAVLVAGGIYLQKMGMMTPQISKGLSEISMRLTIPCLLFTTAIHCTQNRSVQQCPRLIDQLATGWLMLLLPVVYVTVGLLVGWCAAKIGGAGDDFKRSAIAAVTFGNSTGLPITLLAIIQSQFLGESDLGATDPLLFLSIYLVFYPVLQWSVGSWLLQPKMQRSSPDVEVPPQQVNEFGKKAESSPMLSLLFKPEQSISSIVPAGMCLVPLPELLVGSATRTFEVQSAELKTRDGQIAELQRSVSWSHSRNETLGSAARQAGNLRLIPSGASLTNAATSEDLGQQSDLAAVSNQSIAVPLISNPVETKATIIRTVVKRIFPPPVMAALLGLTVALIDPLREVFVDIEDPDGDSPLQWLFEGLVKLGAAAVPINMLILGSSLAKGAARSTISIRLALTVAIAKLVVMPAIGLLLIFIGKKQRLVAEGIDDTFYLVAAVVTATPTANNLMVMAELAGENKEGLATCIFIQYMLAPVLLTGWLSVFVNVATMRST